MKKQTWYWIGGGAAAAVVAYLWWSNNSNQAAVPANAPSSTGSGSGATDPTQQDPGYSPDAQPVTDPMLPPPMMAAPMMVSPPAVPYGQPGHALAFGQWFAQLPIWRRQQLARARFAVRMAAYNAYVASTRRAA